MAVTYVKWILFIPTVLILDTRLVLSEGPVLEGDSWSSQMGIVMHAGHVDMKSWQEELEADDNETLDQFREVEPPDISDEHPDENVPRTKRFMMDKAKYRWPFAVVPYTFDKSVDQQTRKHIEEDIFGLFEYWTHFRFVEWNSSVPESFKLDHSNYLIFMKSGPACWSYTGNNRILKGQKISCCKYVRCIHEIGHALGFIHEISNPLRDDYIRINHQNIINGMSPNFEKITRDWGFKNFGYYDMSSVMGYNTRAFSKNFRSTITMLDPETEYLTKQKDVTAYYMFYEVQNLYDMKASKCPDFIGECVNGGYLSFVNGSCRCRCPEGLDYKTFCSTLDEDVCGDVVTMSSNNNIVNITSLQNTQTYTGDRPCIWFVNATKDSKIAVDFTEFEIPESKSCSTYLELRFILPGQPGIRYCGSGFKKTIISYGEYLAITLSGSTGGNRGHFAASLRLIEADDVCYTNGGKDGSYQGNVNYGKYFQACLPWDTVTHCTFHTFNVTWMDLKHNYCRNPGHGTQPWCYVNADNCARSYCDVCNFRTCYDLFNDCGRQMQLNSNYCTTDPEARRGCRQSCGLCGDRLKVGKVTCNSPADEVEGGDLISNSTSYKLGEKAMYRCKSGGEIKSVICTSEGTWLKLDSVCVDNQVCEDHRSDCDTLLQRTPSMCRQYRDFAKLKCAKSCDLCDIISNQIQEHNYCPVEEVTGNISEISTGPYLTGDFAQYSCRPNFQLVSGDLRRACTSRGTWTGQTPKCIALDDSVSDLFHVDLRRRRHTSKPNKIYTLSNPFYRIRRKGEIIAWQFYSLYSGRVTFHVWRQAGNTARFKLLGSNEIEDTLEDRLVTVNISQSQRISVQPGDFIGVYFPPTNHGGIVYDSCKSNYSPQGANQLVPTSTRLHVGHYYTMKPVSSCQLFSISAKIGPRRPPPLSLLRQLWHQFLFAFM